MQLIFFTYLCRASAVNALCPISIDRRNNFQHKMQQWKMQHHRRRRRRRHRRLVQQKLAFATDLTEICTLQSLD